MCQLFNRIASAIATVIEKTAIAVRGLICLFTSDPDHTPEAVCDTQRSQPSPSTVQVYSVPVAIPTVIVTVCLYYVLVLCQSSIPTLIGTSMIALWTVAVAIAIRPQITRISVNTKSVTVPVAIAPRYASEHPYYFPVSLVQI